jgi:hypothetical protein
MDVRNVLGALLIAFLLVAAGFYGGMKWTAGNFDDQVKNLRDEVAAKDQQKAEAVAAAIAQERGKQAGAEAMAQLADQTSIEAVGALLAAASNVAGTCRATDADIDASNAMLGRVK